MTTGSSIAALPDGVEGYVAARREWEPLARLCDGWIDRRWPD